MQHRTHFLKLAASLIGVFCFSAALTAQASPPKIVVAVFSEEDTQFAETITLYSDGKYQQAETEKEASLYGRKSIPGLGLPAIPNILFNDLKRNGTWRVLDKEGGQLIAFKTLANLPKDAVIEVKGAMPFGITWERQYPYQSHGDRTLPAASFQAAPPPPEKISPPLTGEGGKLV